MGQRHQAFLIARVRARGATNATYRCVAAYHHQWCYGTLPVKAAHRFITLIKQPDNADVIREELLALDGRYGAAQASPEIPDVPCRFLLTVLGNSWDAYVDKDEAQASGTCLEGCTLSANMSCWGGDNNDGITVIDVTYPSDPAVSFFGTYSSTPLTASDYMGIYYPGQIEAYARKLRNGEETAPKVPASQEEAHNAAWKKMLYETAQLFRHVRTVSYGVFAEAWPDKGFGVRKANTAPVSDTQIPSLVDTALREALKHGIDTEDISALVDMVWLVNKLSIVEEVLRDYPVFPDVAVPLLAKLVQGWKRNNALSVGLAGFNLSNDQLKAIIPELDGIRSINLSRNPSLTIRSVESLLNQLPDLRRLLLFDCPSIPDDDVCHLARTSPKLLHHLDALWHPALMTKNLVTPPAFSIICREDPFSFFRGAFPGSSIAIATPSTIVQTLTDFWEIQSKSEGLSLSVSRICEVAWSMPRTENSWDERGVLCQYNEPPWLSEDTFSDWLVLVDTGNVMSVARRWAFIRYGPPVEVEPTSEDTDKASANKSPPVISMKSVHGLEEFLAMLEDEGRPAVDPGVLSRMRAMVERLQIETIPQGEVLSNFGLKNFALWNRRRV